MNIAIVGASGAIGTALVNYCMGLDNVEVIYAFSRSKIIPTGKKLKYHFLDLENEGSIKKSAEFVENQVKLDLVIIATGLLHSTDVFPEKSLKELTFEKFSKLFGINTIGPALVMKHFLPLLNKENRSVFAAISARVGSISDNRLGGWYAYRASKAALNMIIKTASIEIKRYNDKAVIVGLHPGTVDSALSKPFQAGIAREKIFTPAFAVEKIMEVLMNLKQESSGKIFAWDGSEISY